MSDALTNTKLIAHEKALEAAAIAITLVMRAPAPLRSIADQALMTFDEVRAMTWRLLNRIVWLRAFSADHPDAVTVDRR